MDSKKDFEAFGINLSSLNDSVSADSATYELADTITLSAMNMNSSITNPVTIGTNFSNSIWTTTASSTGAKIQLDGKDADVTVNGWSLVDAVKRIEERLGLFQLNPALEKEWEDLQALGKEYRKLEQHIKEKQATFDRLKAMPTPVVD